MAEEQVETRPTTATEIKSGIQLKPGHKTIVIIGDGKGTPLPFPEKPEPPVKPGDPVKPKPPTPKPTDGPSRPKEDPKKPDDKPKDDPKKATPSVKASFGAAHFESDKSFPLPGSLPVFK